MYSFSYLEPVCCSMSSTNCCFLTHIQICQESGQVVWYSHLFKNFSQFVVIHTVKGFGIVNKAEVDVFSGSLLFFRLSKGCWQFDLWFWLGIFFLMPGEGRGVIGYVICPCIILWLANSDVTRRCRKVP